jgi:hypothetical protein
VASPFEEGDSVKEKGMERERGGPCDDVGKAYQKKKKKESSHNCLRDLIAGPCSRGKVKGGSGVSLYAHVHIRAKLSIF